MSFIFFSSHAAAGFIVGLYVADYWVNIIV